MIDDAVSRPIFGIFFAARSQGPLGAKASLPRFFAHAAPKSDNVDNEETCFFVFCVGEEGRDHSKAMPRACKPYMYSRQPPTLHAGKSFISLEKSLNDYASLIRSFLNTYCPNEWCMNCTCTYRYARNPIAITHEQLSSKCLFQYLCDLGTRPLAIALSFCEGLGAVTKWSKRWFV